MNKQCLLLCLCYLLAELTASSVPFIDKCKADDKACLIKSSQKALPFFAAGVTSLGLPPLDPLFIKTATFDEGGFHIEFKDTMVTGGSKCKIIDVERSKSALMVVVECPVEVKGNYKASGNLLLVPVEGDGPYIVKTDDLIFSIKFDLTTVDGKDGQKHWKIGNAEHTFEFKAKTLIDFENLYNGDEKKAAPVKQIINQSWKELAPSIGKPLVDAVVNEFHKAMQKFTEEVPANELEV